ncbi:hypothetical protein ERX46_12860 [Brumimicrobium glaciale]|uniref:Gliding motility lipoprotein GldB n=1 Tax=Brumimicrobium glaciale TaxID=200475 RepID=A0A4Q4KM36_9FLAO|nr:hypothetical protein [Brumimicrobium glaciale]RYM32939.1 hypothetical protein ERX46_12860 [Brumimicrobium glaciale]
MNNRLSLYAILILMAVFYGCTSNPLDVNLPKKEVSLNYINVDDELYKKPKEEVASKVKNLEQQLGDLFMYELSQNIRQNIDDYSYQAIYNFYNSDYISDIEEEKQKLYAELPQHENKINKAFTYLKYHFGDSILPENIFYINKLFSQVTCAQKNIAVGLENYISPKSNVISSIPNAELYQWQRDRMNIDFLERDVLLNWIQVQLFNELDEKLAAHIIQAGKILYILNAAFPNAHEDYVLRYDKTQYDWAVKNETSVWNYLVEQQMLFKTDIRVRTNFLNEGPTTVGLAVDSPDRIGQFLGYRIVKGYMTKNKALSLQALIDTKYNTILQTYEIQ